MMNKESIAVGLDIGTTKIVAMIGKKNEYGKLEILGVGKSKSLGVHRGVVNNITQTIQSIQAAISEAENNSGYRINDVVVGIAGQHIRSIQHSDYISRKNPEEVIGEYDIEQLKNSYPLMNCFHMISNIIDIQSLYNDKMKNNKKNHSSLSAICKQFYNIDMNKNEQLSTWHIRPLYQNQLIYAAIDAAILPILYEKIISI
jgi:cell division protein FtsA